MCYIPTGSQSWLQAGFNALESVSAGRIAWRAGNSGRSRLSVIWPPKRRPRGDPRPRLAALQFLANREAARHGLLLVRRILLVEMADCLQPLIEPFNLCLVLGQQHPVARWRDLPAVSAGRQNFTPVLAVWNAVDEGVA